MVSRHAPPAAIIDREVALDGLNVHGRRRMEALSVLGKMVLHTGRDLDQLTGDDLLGYRAWESREYAIPKTGISVAWVLLRGIADLGEHAHLRDAVRYGHCARPRRRTSWGSIGASGCA
jgi:hypothetical protein